MYTYRDNESTQAYIGNVSCSKLGGKYEVLRRGW